jgi:uncharacterized membrane protein
MESLTKYGKRTLELWIIKSALSLISKRNLSRDVALSNLNFAVAFAGIGPTFTFLKKQYDSDLGIFLSGMIASVWVLLDRDRGRSASFAQILVVRSLYFAIRAWIYERNPKNSKEVSVRNSNQSKSSVSQIIRVALDHYAATCIWVATAFRICYTNFVNPDYFTRSYFDFLIYMLNGKVRFGDNANQSMRALSKVWHHLAREKEPLSLEYIPSQSTSVDHINHWIDLTTDPTLRTSLETASKITKAMPPLIHHDHFGCAMLHPQYSSCITAMVFTVSDVFRMTYRTHIILNMFSFVSGLYRTYKKRKQIPVRELLRLIRKAVVNSFRSCLMMACYFGVYTYSVCKLRLIFGRERLISFGIAGALATPTILIDKPGRLLELNTFTVSKCLESYVLQLKRNDVLHYNR